MQQFLESNEFFNQQHPKLENWLRQIKGSNEREKAVSIFYLVRDDIRYDPFTFLEGTTSLSSDFCLNNKVGYCIPKAALQVTLSRAIGIPARLGLADVRNHLSSSKLDKLLQSDIFTMHGYVEQYLDGQWVKSTPTFNKELCERANLKPLDFDGIHNSIFHQYTADGNKHMEYLTDHGFFNDMPLSFIKKNFALHYPHISIYFCNDFIGERKC
ncbi:MAG: cysteine protease [Colwellia sp. Phe_37]|nr:MAG: cysteine protease [Colwellia sp. Phe_37]